MSPTLRALTPLLFLLGTACATMPSGRRQLRLMADEQMNEMGLQAFDEISSKSKVSTDPTTNAYVGCIVDAIIGVTDDATGVKTWEVKIFEDPSANAFALPGGRIGVHTGMLLVAPTPGQLATVLAHEVSHVIARHGNERVSQNLVAQFGMGVASVALGSEGQTHDLAMAALGIGTQVGVLLPFSRGQESEADLLGLDLMAAAGFDPTESVKLWQNMEKAGGGSPPEFLSTHPSHATRIEDLQKRMSVATAQYQKAQRENRGTTCRPPKPIAARAIRSEIAVHDLSR